MLKTIFLGSRPFVFPLIDTLLQYSHLVAVITKPDAPAGRGEKLTPSPVKQYIQDTDASVPVFSPEKLDDTTYKALQELHPDLLVVAAYGLLIPQRFLDLPTKMTINVHPSLLPHLRGASPVQSAILEGLLETGVSIMKLDEKLDHGPLIHQEMLPIESTDTFVTLGEKAFQKATLILPSILTQIESNSVQLTVQDDSQATFCKQIKREDGCIDPENLPSKEQIDRMIRAYYPWPGVWTNVTVHGQEKRLKLFPGNEVQLEGKRRMSVKEFTNGYPETKSIISALF